MLSDMLGIEQIIDAEVNSSIPSREELRYNEKNTDANRQPLICGYYIFHIPYIFQKLRDTTTLYNKLQSPRRKSSRIVAVCHRLYYK